MSLSDEWIGIVSTTMPKYTKGASDMTLRKRLLLAMLQKRGRIAYNASGTELIWQLKFSQPPVTQADGDGGVVDFSNHRAYRQVSVDWRGYRATDSMGQKQQLMNKGTEALVNLFQSKSNNLQQSISDTFSSELYKDGEATGRESAVHGLETFMGAGTVAAGDIIAQPSDTYGLGQLSTGLAAYGGNWSSGLSTKPNSTVATDWPFGNGSAEYDFNSPKLINWSSSAWGTSAVTWEANCWRAISTGIIWLTTTGGSDGMPSICALSPDMFQGYKNAQEVKTRITVPHKESEDLGFGNTLNQDGVSLQSDFDCPANTGYFINVNQMKVHSLTPQLFWHEGPDKDPRSGWSWLWGYGFWGNVEYKPKHFGKLFSYA
jgi:hypothetical protein